MTQFLTAFADDKKIASGTENDVRMALRLLGDQAQSALVFDDATGRQVDIDMREGADLRPVPKLDSNIRAEGEARGRGRPSLGVKSREVTLLPRHWDWLSTQPGGASVTLRKLVENASKADDAPRIRRAAMEAAGNFATAMAGDRVGYEAATRALYAGDGAGFASVIASWPDDIQSYINGLAGPAFTAA